MLGREMEKLDDDGCSRSSAEARRSSPRSRRCRRRASCDALKANGHTVGFLGDGINDARRAARRRCRHLGRLPPRTSPRSPPTSSCSRRACWCSRRASSKGRETFGNIIKYIKMTASSNFGNVFSVLVASAFLPFLPMLPLHLLIQNLLYDISQLSIPVGSHGPRSISRAAAQMAGRRHRPLHAVHRPDQLDLRHHDVLVMWHRLRAQQLERQSLFQSGWFVEGLLSQTLIVHMIRTEKIPFFQSTAAPPVVLLTTTSHGGGHCNSLQPAWRGVGLQPLPIAYFPWLAESCSPIAFSSRRSRPSTGAASASGCEAEPTKQQRKSRNCTWRVAIPAPTRQ